MLSDLFQTPIRQRAQIIGLIVDESPLVDCYILLWRRRVKLSDVDLLILTLRFKIFAKVWLEKMLESPVNKPSRSDQFDDFHLF